MDAKNVMEQAWTQNTASAHFVIAMWGAGDILCHVFRSCLTLNEMGYWSSLDVLKQSSFILIRNTLLRRFQKYVYIKESTELVELGLKMGKYFIGLDHLRVFLINSRGFIAVRP